MKRYTLYNIYSLSALAVGSLLVTSCLGGTEGLEECKQPYDIVYRTQLISNEDHELMKELVNVDATIPETELASRLKSELRDLFTFEETTDRVVETTIPDLQLCFYRGLASTEQFNPNDSLAQPEITYRLIENVGATNKTFPSDLNVMLPYWHAAFCGIEANKRQNGPVAGLSHFGRGYASTLSLYQPEAVIAYSHTHSVYTGRVHLPAYGQDNTYYCNMYQVNCAAAAVLDLNGFTFDKIEGYITHTSDRFDIQDSVFHYTNPDLKILCNRMQDTGSALECLWGACLPSPNAVTRTEYSTVDAEGGIWQFLLEFSIFDTENNKTKIYKTICHVKEPLRAAELQILKLRLKSVEPFEIECVNAEVSVSVDIQWQEGLEWEVPLI